MLEGLRLLKWARADSEERALMWRAYALVIDWRHLRRDERAGKPFDAAYRASIDQRLATEGVRFLTDKAQNAIAQGADLPGDPYRQTWYIGTLKEIFESVGGSDLYDGPYGNMSDWHHWNAAGVAQGMWREGNEFGFNARSMLTRMSGLSNAFQALQETSLLVCNYLNLPSADIVEFGDKVIAAGAAAGYT